MYSGPDRKDPAAFGPQPGLWNGEQGLWLNIWTDDNRSKYKKCLKV